MIYVLEYLNADAEIEILRYNTETREHDIHKSVYYGGTYVEPRREFIYLCEEMSNTSEEGQTKAWMQKLGEFRPEFGNGKDFEQTDAYVFIHSLIEDNLVEAFMDNLLENVQKNRGSKKKFVQEVKLR